MKKTFYLLFMFIGLVFTSCEPMEDIHDEIDAELEGKVAGTIDSYTLTEDDYKEILDLTHTNFGTVEEAKALIPVVLDKVFPSFGNESSLNAAYNLYNPMPTADTIITYYTTDSDYEQYGSGDPYYNFDRRYKVFNMIEDKWPNPEDKTLLSLSYGYYDGASALDLNNGFFYTDGEWNMIPGLTDEEYRALGEDYSNFSNISEAESKLLIYVQTKFQYEALQKGDIKPIMFKWYSGGTKTGIMYFIYNGMSWELYNDVIRQSLQFGHDGDKWVPDNTIAYTLTADDYEMVDNGKYKNFDYWDAEDIAAAHEKIITILETRFPNAEVGQKFLVSYLGFNGSANTYTAKFIVNESGEIVLQ